MDREKTPGASEGLLRGRKKFSIFREEGRTADACQAVTTANVAVAILGLQCRFSAAITAKCVRNAIILLKGRFFFNHDAKHRSRQLHFLDTFSVCFHNLNLVSSNLHLALLSM